jgi:hypothetical protein
MIYGKIKVIIKINRDGLGGYRAGGNKINLE